MDITGRGKKAEVKEAALEAAAAGGRYYVINEIYSHTGFKVRDSCLHVVKIISARYKKGTLLFSSFPEILNEKIIVYFS